MAYAAGKLLNTVLDMFSETTFTQRIRDALLGAALSVACLVGPAPVARGQEPVDSPSAQSQTESDLTEGLLDLLTEPGREPTDATPPPTQEDAAGAQPAAAVPKGGEESGDASSSPSPTATPAAAPAIEQSRGLGAEGIGESDSLDGEDLGAGRTNPLADVRLGMLTAAGWLRERGEVDKTQQLQRDIVARLDQLIADLDQQSPTPAPTPSSMSSGDPQTQPPQTPEGAQPGSSQQAGQPSGTTTGTGQEQTAGETTSGQHGEADGSGTQGQPAAGGRERSGVVVDLNDPTALQRSVWGNLPDRVREQMQSRMVERFLPGYREEIEAYYRALSR